MPDLLLLFLSSLIAATLLPVQSEAVLASLQLSGEYSGWLLVGVATFGNVLGACVNWLLGRYLLHFKDRKWFPVKQAALDKASLRFQRYGVWTLFFAWLPFIGDPLTFVAGMLRVRFLLFLLLVALGKAARYAAIVLVLWR